MKKAMALNPNHPSWYHIGLFYDYYRKHEYETALESLLSGGLVHIPFIQMNLAAAFAELGREREAPRGDCKAP